MYMWAHSRLEHSGVDTIIGACIVLELAKLYQTTYQS